MSGHGEIVADSDLGSASAHFAWAVDRAREYLDLGEPVNAIGSLISDLGKHSGTRQILNPALTGLLYGELRLGGNDGVRRFVEGLAGPGGSWRSRHAT